MCSSSAPANDDCVFQFYRPVILEASALGNKQPVLKLLCLAYPKLLFQVAYQVTGSS